MSKEDKKVTSNLEEGGDKTPESNETAEDKKGLNAETLLHQKLAKEKKLEELQTEFDEYKTNNPQKDTATKENTEEKSTVSEERLEAIEFTLKHLEIESKTSIEILEVARAKGIKPEEAVELPYFKTYIEKQKEDKASSSAVSTTSRSLKVPPPKPIKDMTQEEHKKLWEENNK